MTRSLLAIINNTFTETFRQPIYGVVIGLTMLLLIFSPSLVMFSMEDDNQLLWDIGMSTLMVAGLFLAVFASASVVTEEIERKTALTVVSKPVSRSIFVIGKFLGIAGAVIVAQYLLSLVFLIIVRHGVLQRASDDSDMVVIYLGSGAISVTSLIGLAGNYFYQWRFSSSAVAVATILGTLLMATLCFIDPHWQYNPAENHIHTELIGPLILTTLATLTLTVIATAAAFRFNMVTTLVICLVAFILGAMVHYKLGPVAAEAGVKSYFAWAALALVPSINIYIVTDAIYNETVIPLNYIAQTAIYCLCYICAVLVFTINIFRNREIG